jgi:hypothetical protein
MVVPVFLLGVAGTVTLTGDVAFGYLVFAEHSMVLTAAAINVGFEVCAVERRRFPVGASPTRRFAPAGSNRSRHGGDELSETFG